MCCRLPVFDRFHLKLKPIVERKHGLTLSDILPLQLSSSVKRAFRNVDSKIITARARSAAIVLMMGGHVIRAGVQRYLIDLMEHGYLTFIAMNGGGMILTQS